MPWKGQTVEERRKEFVRRALAKEKSHSALCEAYGISRPTGYKWIERHQLGEDMQNRSRAPLHQPNKTSAGMEAVIVGLREKHPAIGAKKMKRMLENEGHAAPAYSTINAILHRNGLITPEASQAATPYKRFEKSRPNEMWQADFKGHFAMKNGSRCHPLTIIDDHSRFCVCLAAMANERYEGLMENLQIAFEQYGLPDVLLCDNGSPFGAGGRGYSRMEVSLMDLGIVTKHGRIHHPQTQGKNERFNGTLLRERIRYRNFESCNEAQKDFNEYRQFYNETRPHHALDLQVPISRYIPSSRPLPQQIDPWAYAFETMVRRVRGNGYIKFFGREYYLGEAFAKKEVGLVQAFDESDLFFVLYRKFCIARLNAQEHTFQVNRPFVLQQNV